MARRRPSWTKPRGKSGATFRKDEGVPFGRRTPLEPCAPMDTRPRVISRDEQMAAAKREIDATDSNIPPKIRCAFRTHCSFDIEFQVLMRFARHAERSKLTEVEIANVFKGIKTEADAAKFRAIWRQS